jgi:hypothetical protein
MARLSIELPDDVKAKAEIRAAESGHQTVEAYLASLIRADADGAGEDFGAPASLTFKSQKQLETMLLEGLASPASDMTGADWADLKRKALNRPAK